MIHDYTLHICEFFQCQDPPEPSAIRESAVTMSAPLWEPRESNLVAWFRRIFRSQPSGDDDCHGGGTGLPAQRYDVITSVIISAKLDGTGERNTKRRTGGAEQGLVPFSGCATRCFLRNDSRNGAKRRPLVKRGRSSGRNMRKAEYFN